MQNTIQAIATSGATTAAALSLLLGVALPALAGAESTVSAEDIQTLAQLVLDDDGLEPYYHLETRPERKPLVVVKNEFFTAEPALRALGEPVVFKPASELGEDAPYLRFDRFTVHPDLAYVLARYPVEGVVLEAHFVRYEDGWQLSAMSVAEE